MQNFPGGHDLIDQKIGVSKSERLQLAWSLTLLYCEKYLFFKIPANPAFSALTNSVIPTSASFNA
jgi:hypothetical protein